MLNSLSVILLLVFSSSAIASTTNCSKYREDELLQILQRLKVEDIRLRGQEIEILALENEIIELNSISEQKEISVDIKSQYKHSGTGLYADDRATTNYSEQQLSANYLASISQLNKRSADTAKVDLAQAKLASKKLIHDGQLLQKTIEIKKLTTVLELTETKLPFINSKIDYYELLGELSTGGFKELADAELDKIKISNEINNLVSRIQLESASFNSQDLLLKIISEELQFSEKLIHPNLAPPCNFVDIETAKKDKEITIAEYTLLQSENNRLPSVSISSSLSSRDYHSGAQKNNFSFGVGLTVPLYDGGVTSSDVMIKKQRLALLQKEKYQLIEQHIIKLDNFTTLEQAIIASMLESREKINKLDGEIKELLERQKMGQSNFEELITKQIQKIDIEIISEELWTRLVDVWASHWENLVAG